MHVLAFSILLFSSLIAHNEQHYCSILVARVTAICSTYKVSVTDISCGLNIHPFSFILNYFLVVIFYFNVDVVFAPI